MLLMIIKTLRSVLPDSKAVLVDEFRSDLIRNSLLNSIPSDLDSFLSLLETQIKKSGRTRARIKISR